MSITQRTLDVLVRTISPIVAALVAGGLLLWSLGADPVEFYADVIRLGLLGNGWQQSLIAMAPLLLIALGLIVSFRAQLWNLGYAGTYVCAAAVVIGIAPDVMVALPYSIAVLTLVAVGLAVGLLLALVPAFFKLKYGVTEVVTSLMTSFIALGVANMLIKGVFKDPSSSLQHTRVLDLEYMLPFVPGTQVHVGIIVALGLVVIAHVVLTKSAFGLQIDMLGANPKAAAHAGVNIRRLTLIVFFVSGGLVALAAVIDMLGLWGYTRADWNPGYGDKILPFVFLARLSPLASVPLVAFYSVLATGGTIAAQRADISVDVLSIIVALILFFMLLIELAAVRVRARSARSNRLARTWLGDSYLRRSPIEVQR